MNVEAAEAAPGRRAKVTTDSLSPRSHQELSDLASEGHQWVRTGGPHLVLSRLPRNLEMLSDVGLV